MLELLTTIALWCAAGESVHTAAICKRKTLSCVLSRTKNGELPATAIGECFLKRGGL